MAAQNKPSSLKKEKIKAVELKKLFYWQSPARPFKKRDRDYFTTIGAIVFLLAVILFFLKEWLLIAVVISLMFVSYVLATVQPEKVEHTLTNKGIETGGKNYPWKDMAKFWFTEKWKHFVLNIELKEGFPRKLLVLVEERDKSKVETILRKYLAMEVPEPTFIDKTADWLSKKVPLENES
jgi:Ca2+/Na+ antiporter